MFTKFKQNPNSQYFLAYCISYIGYGATFNGIGPLIPYLASNQHVLETDYSFLFLNRAIGFVAGALLVKVIKPYMSFHQIMMLFSVLIFLSLTAFTMSSSMFLQGMFYLLSAMFSSTLQVVLNVAILTSHTGQNQEFFIQISHGMFGIGGLIAPLLVLVCQEYALMATSFIILMVFPAYYSLDSPQKQKTIIAKELLEARSGIADELRRIQTFSKSSNHESNKLRDQKQKFVYLTCFLFFVYIGQEVALGGWISSFAVLQHISSKEQATGFTSIFWIFMTAFRFILAYVELAPSKKLKIAMIAQITVAVVVLFTFYILAQAQSSVWIASVGFGITFSVMFGLFFVLPNEFGVQVTTEQCSSFLMYGQLGEGVISMLVGYLMGWVSPVMLFVSILGCGVILLVTCNRLIALLASTLQAQNQQKFLQMNSSFDSEDRDGVHISVSKAINKRPGSLD